MPLLDKIVATPLYLITGNVPLVANRISLIIDEVRLVTSDITRVIPLITGNEFRLPTAYFRLLVMHLWLTVTYH